MKKTISFIILIAFALNGIVGVFAADWIFFNNNAGGNLDVKYFNGTNFTAVTLTGVSQQPRGLNCKSWGGSGIACCMFSPNNIYTFNVTQNTITKTASVNNPANPAGGECSVEIINNTYPVAAITSSNANKSFHFATFNVDGTLNTIEYLVAPTSGTDSIKPTIIKNIPNTNDYIIVGRERTTGIGFIMIKNGSSGKFVTNTTIINGTFSDYHPTIVCPDVGNSCVLYHSNETTSAFSAGNQSLFFIYKNNLTISNRNIPKFGDNSYDGHMGRFYDKACAVPGTDKFVVLSATNNGNDNVLTTTFNATSYKGTDETGTRPAKSTMYASSQTGWSTESTSSCFVDRKNNQSCVVYLLSGKRTKVAYNCYNATSKKWRFSSANSPGLYNANQTSNIAGQIQTLKTFTNVFDNETALSFVTNDRTVWSGVYWNGNNFSGVPVNITGGANKIDNEGSMGYEYVIIDSNPNLNGSGAGSNQTQQSPPLTPTSIMCNSGSCNGTFTNSVNLQCSGSVDSEGDLVTYFIEKGDLAGTLSEQNSSAFIVTKDTDTTNFNDKVYYSANNPPSEIELDAFDRDYSTKWLTLNQNKGWIIYSLQGSGPRRVTEYTITSANDWPTRDPNSWTLEGSDDNITWTVLDSRANQAPLWTSRFMPRNFSIDNSKWDNYLFYKLNFTSNGGDVHMQIAEIEFWDESTGSNSIYYSSIGNHTQGNSYNWNLAGESPETYENLRCRAIDLGGSNNYSQYLVKDTLLTIGSGADTTPPTISALVNSTTTNQSVKATWSTNENANETTTLGVCPSFSGVFSNKNSTFTGPGSQHVQSIGSLANSTNYCYKTTACDVSGNCANSNFTFITASNPSQQGTIASESEGDNAISLGIQNSLVSGYTENNDQLIYARSLSNDQFSGTFDRFAKKNGKVWAFNYVTNGESAVANTFNLTPSVYVLQLSGLTSSQITMQVENLVNATR